MKNDLVPVAHNTHHGWRHTLAAALVRLAAFFDGATYRAILPNATSADPSLASAIARARKIKELGYDISLQFLPRTPDAPHLYICAGRYTARGKTSEWLASGFDTHSQGAALTKASGELAERLLWRELGKQFTKQFVRSSVRALEKRALPIDGIAGFSRKQRSLDRNLSFDLDSVFSWVEGRTLSRGTRVMVPLQLVAGAHPNHVATHEPLLRIPNSNGLASHTSIEVAQYHGLLEVIERDAFMIAFHNMISAPRIRHSSLSNPASVALLRDLDRYGLACTLLLLPTDMPTTVVCALLHDTSGVGPALAVGAKAHHNPETAVHGALVESLGVWSLAHARKTHQEETADYPWNMFQRLAFWGKKEHQGKIAWMWSGDEVNIPSGKDNATDARSLASAAEVLGCTVAWVRLSTPALERIGYFCAQVVSPEMQPINLDSHPLYLGGTRLKSVPEKLGFPARSEPPPYPHPFP